MRRLVKRTYEKIYLCHRPNGKPTTMQEAMHPSMTWRIAVRKAVREVYDDESEKIINPTWEFPHTVPMTPEEIEPYERGLDVARFNHEYKDHPHVLPMPCDIEVYYLEEQPLQ